MTRETTRMFARPTGRRILRAACGPAPAAQATRANAEINRCMDTRARADAPPETNARLNDQTCAPPPPAAVSVVVPSYNHAPFIETALRSIFRQTHTPAELVVIDDGSSDNSAQIIERVLKDAPCPCEFVARANRGLAATLNEGFARTTRGRYFAYLGSDDLWLPEFLAARVALLDARPQAVVAYGHAYSIDERERIIDCTTDWAHYVDGDVRRMLLSTLAPLSPTVVYRCATLAR